MNGTAHRPTPPAAERRRRETVVFDDTLVDDYYWLRERENPEVIALLEAENRYTAEVLRHTEPLQRRLFEELAGYLVESDSTAPAPNGPYRYYDRTEAGKQYAIHCRTLGDGPEEVLLDENALAEGQAYFRMGVFRLSPSQRLLAYSTDTNGGERFSLVVLDLATRDIVAGPIPNVSEEVEWADDRTLLYATCDSAWRTSELRRHVVDGGEDADTLVYREADESYWVHLSRTRSGEFLVLHLKSNTSSEIAVVPAARPHEPPRTVVPRRPGVLAFLGHSGGHFYLRTNDGAPNYQVVRVPVADPGAAPEVVVPHRDDVTVDSIELFAGHLVVEEREGGLGQLRVVDLATGEQHRVAMPEPVYALNMWLPHANAEHETPRFRFGFSSLVTPERTYDYDMAARRLELVREQAVPGYDPAGYRLERLFATAPDGTRVPISLVLPAGAPRDGSRPLFLYGYGAYGATTDPAFSTRRLPLLRRGVACAIAHIRGSGDLGRAWYEAGKVLTKRNSFTDFIACAEHLIAEGYTSAERLVIKGRSAGGLLMGAVTTMRPDLFRAVIAGVPFVDVVNTSLDPSIPLVVIEYEEWGDPRVREQYEYLRSYSPYDNTAPRAYPAILATAGLYDPRVQYWEPAKWVQKLRDVTTGDRPALLKTEMVGGHAGPSGRYDYLRDLAFEYAFFLDALDMLEEPAP